jgi:hypothetical protein
MHELTSPCAQSEEVSMLQTTEGMSARSLNTLLDREQQPPAQPDSSDAALPPAVIELNLFR